MTWTVKMVDARYDGYEEGFDQGREEGLSIGLERGAYENKLETAKAILSLGLSLDQIQLCTGLPLETVMELVQEM